MYRLCNIFCVLVFLLLAVDHLVVLSQVKDDFCYPFTGAEVVQEARKRRYLPQKYGVLDKESVGESFASTLR